MQQQQACCQGERQECERGKPLSDLQASTKGERQVPGRESNKQLSDEAPEEEDRGQPPVVVASSSLWIQLAGLCANHLWWSSCASTVYQLFEDVPPASKTTACITEPVFHSKGPMMPIGFFQVPVSPAHESSNCFHLLHCVLTSDVFYVQP